MMAALLLHGNGQDGDRSGIFAHRYEASGALFGPEFQVNNYIASNQQSPVVAPLNDGGFVVTWMSDGQDGDQSGIFGQRYEASGALFGSEFQVNNFTTGTQYYPAIAPLNDGGFVVTWMSDGQVGSQFSIFAQRYDNAGAIVGSEFQVNNYTANFQLDPVVAPLNDGGFVIAWDSFLQDGNAYGIFAQRYDQGGNPIPLNYVPTIGSASTLRSNANTTFPISQLYLTSSSTSGNIFSSSSSTPPSSRDLSQTTGGVTTPSVQVESSAVPSTQASTSTSGMLTGSSPSSGSGIPALIDVVYGQNYTFSHNGQIIGSFTISGGSGPYSTNNPNTLEIEFDPNYELQDGDTLTLFSVPEGENVLWDGITLIGEECFSAEGELVPHPDTNQNDYQVIFDVDEDQCSIYSDATKLSAIPVLAGGGLILIPSQIS